MRRRRSRRFTRGGQAKFGKLALRASVDTTGIHSQWDIPMDQVIESSHDSPWMMDMLFRLQAPTDGNLFPLFYIRHTEKSDGTDLKVKPALVQRFPLDETLTAWNNDFYEEAKKWHYYRIKGWKLTFQFRNVDPQTIRHYSSHNNYPNILGQSTVETYLDSLKQSKAYPCPMYWSKYIPARTILPEVANIRSGSWLPINKDLDYNNPAAYPHNDNPFCYDNLYGAVITDTRYFQGLGPEQQRQMITYLQSHGSVTVTIKCYFQFKVPMAANALANKTFEETYDNTKPGLPEDGPQAQHTYT